MKHEFGVEFCVDSNSGLRSVDFLIAKKSIFLAYANLCKLGDYMVDIHSQYAEPSIDEVCQILLYSHYLLKSYAKKGHQRTPSGESTHF